MLEELCSEFEKFLDDREKEVKDSLDELAKEHEDEQHSKK